ncbi:CopD family protein [uncultured Tateyamaria sp.]|uniref:copper resistance D family protein n=1 Tax=uncultured Tateyamaria sp. TaxID=455651 RepID=UPI002611D54D|nr:CopD family protein [uncultured Tateyamaria sp.]
MPDGLGLLAIGLKWAVYTGTLGAAGTVMCALAFGLRRTAGLAAGFASLGLVAAVATFVMKGAALTGDATGMTDPEMLGLLWRTQSGTALQIQVGGFVLLMAGLGLGRIGAVLSGLGGVAALSSFVLTGHIATRESVLLSGLLLLHLVGIAGWIGILIPLRRLARTPSTMAQAATLGHRFGRVASVFVPVLIVAGGIMAYRLLGSAGALVSTGYGQALLLKILAVSALLGLAALNKVRFVPALARGDRTAARRLAASITVELSVFALILAVTAILTSALTLPT